jgi:hypothetical protein
MLNKFMTASIFTLSLMLIGSYGNAEQALSQKVQDSSGKYVVEFPKDWKVTDGKSLGVDYVAEAPAPGKDNFTNNANILTEQLDSTMTPKEYFDKGMIDLKKFDGFKLTGINDVDINGFKGVEAEYSYLYNGIQIDVLQYAVIKDKSVVVLTFGASPADYPTVKPLFSDIAKTLVVK